MTARVQIKPVITQEEYSLSSKILRESYAAVALDYGLTASNCPSNGAFINDDELQHKKNDRLEYFLAMLDRHPIGFIAIEQAFNTPEIFYIEKVAILPEYRRKGCGKQLMDFATDRIRNSGGREISLGIIAANTSLKNWYLKQGFVDAGEKNFPHLPFTVCFLRKELT